MNRTTIVLDEECVRILKAIKYVTGMAASAIIRDLIKDYAKTNEVKINQAKDVGNEKSI